MANPVRNAFLADLLRQAEQAKIQRHKEKVHQQTRDLAAGDPLQSRRNPALPSPLLMIPLSTTVGKRQQGHHPTPQKALPLSSGPGNTAENPSDEGQTGNTIQTKIVPLTLDEMEWLTSVAARTGHATISGVVRRLVEWANAETPEAKKKVFLQVRCRRCSAGAKGGVKTHHDLEIPSVQWQWLMNVNERCNHATVGKTVRIIVDFYMPLCKSDPDFEQKVVHVGRNVKSSRHQDAVGRVAAACERGMGA